MLLPHRRYQTNAHSSDIAVAVERLHRLPFKSITLGQKIKRHFGTSLSTASGNGSYGNKILLSVSVSVNPFLCFASRGDYKVGTGTEDLVHIEAFLGRCDTGGQLELRVLTGGLQHTAEGLRLLLPGHAHVALFHCHEPLLPIARPELLELLLQGLRPPCHYRPQFWELRVRVWVKSSKER
ncbi:uncharacterized protein LOC122027891 [Zingiber officinale]|uniref:Uncharacterized protein n=1 Tax=Zingiber officinale TaxID=94328 RepID=A0A8J5CCP0_ZINOF|nr:uncharacterized protein LOC122027891 [Zingiber officinale]KAG6473066.1 hypothetical protein ZIOFF_066973 [Zingiber officinale]